MSAVGWLFAVRLEPWELTFVAGLYFDVGRYRAAQRATKIADLQAQLWWACKLWSINVKGIESEPRWKNRTAAYKADLFISVLRHNHFPVNRQWTGSILSHYSAPNGNGWLLHANRLKSLIFILNLAWFIVHRLQWAKNGLKEENCAVYHIILWKVEMSAFGWSFCTFGW